jgi:hypothetical protein
MATYTYVDVTSVAPARGTTFGGQSVTIRGSGFSLATGVTFGGVSATDIIYVSDTVITCVTPQHASGAVTVAVIGVDSLASGYTYVVPVDRLPPIPWPAPLVQPGSAPPLLNAPWITYFQIWKDRIEQLPGQVPAESVVGVLDPDQIPDLPWSRIEKAGASLGDLETRDAGDINAGILEHRYGGTGRAYAYSVAPGSFSVADGTYSIHLSRLKLTGFERVTVLGTGRVGIL